MFPLGLGEPTTIPPSRLRRATSLYTREALSLRPFYSNALGPSVFPSSGTGSARATFPQGKAHFRSHPAIAAQSRRAPKQGMIKTNTDGSRAAAGGERKHYHKSPPAPVKSNPSFPSGWLPRVRGRSPGDLWVLSITGKYLARRRNSPRPRTRRRNPDPQKPRCPQKRQRG